MADAAAQAEALAVEADALAAAAAAQVQAALGAPVVAAAQGTPVAAIAQAAVDLAAFVRQAMEAALLAGFRTELRNQQAATPDALDVRMAEGADFAAALARVPVQGHTCARTGEYQGQAYAFGAEGVLGTAAATGAPAGIAVGLAEEARLAGNRAGAAVGEAYHTGAGAARLAVGAALQRAVANA